MDTELKNKVVIVTESASDIGRATVDALFEEVAYFIVFLASNKLAGHVTGQLISPDGGYVYLDRNI